jgi:hypothetical protein
VAVVGPALLLAPQLSIWAARQLPAFAAQTNPLAIFNHAMNTALPGFSPVPLQALLLGSWLVGAALVVARDPALVFAGALAISTSFANTSWDYNLITTFPLLVVQYQRAAERRWVPLADGLLLVGLVAVAGNRLLFSLSPDLMQGRVVLLWAWLVASGLAAWWIARPSAPVPAASTDGVVLPTDEAIGGAA